MFEPITLPYGAKMLFNTVKLRPGVTFEAVAEKGRKGPGSNYATGCKEIEPGPFSLKP